MSTRERVQEQRFEYRAPRGFVCSKAGGDDFDGIRRPPAEAGDPTLKYQPRSQPKQGSFLFRHADHFLDEGCSRINFAAENFYHAEMEQRKNQSSGACDLSRVAQRRVDVLERSLRIP